MASWTNYATIAGPRNGTTSHTVNPSTGLAAANTGSVGTTFTYTAGRFAVCVVEGAVTSTTPTGWTLPANGSSINGTGLYVFTKTAAGSDTLTTTHNGSNYPVAFHFFEFPAGSTFQASATSINNANGGSGPNLTGLTGTYTAIGAYGRDLIGTQTEPGVTWGAGTALVTASVLPSGTDGYGFSIAYADGLTATSQQWAATGSGTGAGSVNHERLLFALNVAGAGAATNPRPVQVTRQAVNRAASF